MTVVSEEWLVHTDWSGQAGCTERGCVIQSMRHETGPGGKNLQNRAGKRDQGVLKGTLKVAGEGGGFQVKEGLLLDSLEPLKASDEDPYHRTLLSG